MGFWGFGVLGFWACTVGGVVVVESALVSVLAPSFCPELGLGQGGSVVGLALPTGCRMGSVVVVVPVLVVIVLVSSVVLSVTVSVADGVHAIGVSK